jgi:hypothetical protein
MATYNFTTSGDTFSLAVNGTSVGTWDKTDGRNIIDDKIHIDVSGIALILSLADPYYSAHMRENEDILQIEGVTHEGSVLSFAASLKDDVMSVASAGGGVSYSSYVAILTQTGTAAPVATVLESSVGTVIISRLSAGSYALTSAEGTFPADKTYISGFGDWNGSNNPYMPIHDSGAVVGYYTLYGAGGDGDTLNLSFRNVAGEGADISTLIGEGGSFYLPEIRVYP